MNGRDVVFIGILSSAITVAKLTLSFLPNIEVVTLLFILYTIVFGKGKTLLTSIIFSTTEILIYGFSTWLIGYYLLWPLLILIVDFMKEKTHSEYGYGIIGAIWGYGFGIFFSLIESLFYGPAYGWVYWIRGIPFDLIHGTSNFIIIIILFKPMKNLLLKLKNMYYIN